VCITTMINHIFNPFFCSNKFAWLPVMWAKKREMTVEHSFNFIWLLCYSVEYLKATTFKMVVP